MLVALLAAGCASTPPPVPIARGGRGVPRPAPAPIPPPPTPVAAVDSLSAQEEADLAAVQAERYEGPVGSSNDDLDEELEEFLSEESHAVLTERVDFDIPIVINERVEYYIDYFQRRVRTSFEKWLARAPTIVPYLRARFRQEGLPEDLIYMSLIESGFSPQARSRADAVGYWQFIAPTGRRYGLRIDGWVDERRDLERSTEAAIAYLKDLHEMFGSWYLAAAAYNSGEGKIQRAIQRYGSEDLWELSEFSYLREETKDYVPKLIAATLIAREPERYGFVDVQPLPPVEVDLVGVPAGTDLRRVAAAAVTTLETIRTLNPQLRSRATPPGQSVAVRVPRGAGEGFAQRFAAAPVPRVDPARTHRVRRGETPSVIARRYGVSVRELMAANGIRDARRLLVGQRLRLPAPEGGWPDEPAPRAAAAASPTEVASVGTTTSAPAPAGGDGASGAPAPAILDVAGAEAPAGGDSAAAAVPPEVLLAAPGPGFTAEAPHGVPVPAPPPDPAPSITETVRYEVRSGDTIYRIARAHGLSVADVERANPGALAELAPGRVLVLHPPGTAASAAPPAHAPPADAPPADGPSEPVDANAGRVVHLVAPGDTLWSIARQHGVTPEDLRRWNDLQGTSLRTGQRLVVFPPSS